MKNNEPIHLSSRNISQKIFEGKNTISQIGSKTCYNCVVRTIKRLAFFLPFFLSFLGFAFYLRPFLQDPTSILSLEKTVLIQLSVLLVFLLSVSFFFTIFALLAYDWRIILPVCTITSYVPLIFSVTPENFIFVSGSLLTFGMMYASVYQTIKTYLAFQPTKLFIPLIKHTATLLLLVSSLTFFLSSQAEIQKDGFHLPPSLIDLSLKLLPNQGGFLSSGQQKEKKPMSTLSQDQIKALRENPQLLSQFGLNPSMLDNLTNTKQQTLSMQTLMKSTIESQLQNYIKPYVQFVPMILAVIFFLTVQSLLAVFELLLTPVVWSLFWFLEAVGFITFTLETREVKKLVI